MKDIIKNHDYHGTSVTAMPNTYSDEYIQHWGVVYCANELKNSGFSFEDFLKDPEAILQQVRFGIRMPPEEDFYPLLQQQKIVKERQELIEAEEEIAAYWKERGNGRVIEMHGGREIQPMRKKRTTAKWKSNTHNKFRSAHHA